ncbi:hypothetical protein AVBRAN12642_08260, partial [Campylobacter sp. RM12642]|nr:hypothetical protein [Campylobacter sp. RM12642]
MKILVKDKSELIDFVLNQNIDLSYLDTSLITDMSELFLNSNRKDFSGINTWDTS